MKMIINEVLESYNKAIDKMRNIRDINVRGHFASTTELEKAMGPCKQCTVKIVYVDLDKNRNCEFCQHIVKERCLTDEEGVLVKKTELEALTLFFLRLRMLGIWEQVINGNYGDKR